MIIIKLITESWYIFFFGAHSRCGRWNCFSFTNGLAISTAFSTFAGTRFLSVLCRARLCMYSYWGTKGNDAFLIVSSSSFSKFRLHIGIHYYWDRQSASQTTYKCKSIIEIFHSLHILHTYIYTFSFLSNISIIGHYWNKIQYKFFLFFFICFKKLYEKYIK